MNKKVKGASFIVLGLFLTYLLINRRGIEASNNSEGNILFLFLDFFTLFSGKMAWIIIGILLVTGLAFLIKKEVRVSRRKELTGVVCFLAISLLFIREDIVSPLPDSFTDAGRIILELGFGKESGGIVGSLVAMPLYKVITTTAMGIFLWAVVGLSILYLLSSPLEYLYEWIKGVRQYYKSDEYKDKVKLLKAKKMSEKLKRTDYKKYQKEEMKKRIIESRNQKLSFELAKKPKDSFLDKTEIYSDEELAKKEEEEKAQKEQTTPKEPQVQDVSQKAPAQTLLASGITVDSNEVTNFSKTLLGVPYVWGGTSLDGFDCSGFVQYVYKKYEMDLSRTTYTQIKQGKSIALSDIKENDLVFFDTRASSMLTKAKSQGVSGTLDTIIINESDTGNSKKLYPSEPTHVGMYIGNGKMIHASSSKKQVVVEVLENDYFKDRIVDIRRYK